MRRAALLQTAAALAPRPDRQAAACEPVYVAGYFRTASGLGQSARLCHAACRALGYETHAIDLSARHMQTTDLSGDGVISHTRGHQGQGTLILHVNGPLVPLALLQLGRAFVRGKRIIGYWAWELERVPADWTEGLRHVHEVWVPSQFTAEAVRYRSGGVPVRVVPHPLAVGTRPPATGSRGCFRVLTLFNAASSFARKNPCAAIAAFRRAFEGDKGTELVVKSSHLDLYPAGRAMLGAAMAGACNIRHVDVMLPPGGVDALYNSSDAVLSLHRSEGFGLIVAEAMLRSLPVVATDWSGNRDFLWTENGCPVRHTLVPAHDPQGVYDCPDLRWAEADLDHAASLLRGLRANPDLRARLGRQAAADAARLFSVDTFGRVLQQTLERPGAKLS